MSACLRKLTFAKSTSLFLQCCALGGRWHWQAHWKAILAGAEQVGLANFLWRLCMWFNMRMCPLCPGNWDGTVAVLCVELTETEIRVCCLAYMYMPLPCRRAISMNASNAGPAFFMRIVCYFVNPMVAQLFFLTPFPKWSHAHAEVQVRTVALIIVQ